ncbi:hypothetical protein [Rugamonas sp.]|uniref:hypothetical protein n=1 Tax=Rugamonas sp. TaxID=1926287 RepID=UPI0025F60520|nr:hypothetical protein [Rugamonas sp.]
MSRTVHIAVELTPELEHKLHELAALPGQSLALIAQDALKHYVAWRSPQLADLAEAIAAADRGEFASDEEVNAVLSRYDA